MGNEQWAMGYGLWAMGYGLWAIDNVENFGPLMLKLVARQGKDPRPTQRKRRAASCAMPFAGLSEGGTAHARHQVPPSF